MIEEEEASSVAKSEKNDISIDYHAHSKKTKKRARVIQKQIERIKRSKRDNQLEKESIQNKPLFPAILMINDPQTLVDNLFRKIRQSRGDAFNIKLLPILDFRFFNILL